ncbi:MAG: hypothetical protein ABEJ42_03235 [Halobacteriaceae archaeon]
MALEFHFHGTVFEYNTGRAAEDEAAAESTDVAVEESGGTADGRGSGAGALLALAALAVLAYGVRRLARRRGSNAAGDVPDAEELTVAD